MAASSSAENTQSISKVDPPAQPSPHQQCDPPLHSTLRQGMNMRFVPHICDLEVLVGKQGEKPWQKWVSPHAHYHKYSCAHITPCSVHSPPAAPLASIWFLKQSQNYFARLPAFFLRNSSEKIETALFNNMQ